MRKKIDLNFEEMDFSDIECEQIDVVEYEFSENISILYNKSTKQFSIEGLDQDTFDEYDIDIEEPFEDMEIDNDLNKILEVIDKYNNGDNEEEL